MKHLKDHLNALHGTIPLSSHAFRGITPFDIVLAEQRLHRNVLVLGNKKIKLKTLNII